MLVDPREAVMHHLVSQVRKGEGSNPFSGWVCVSKAAKNWMGLLWGRERWSSQQQQQLSLCLWGQLTMLLLRRKEGKEMPILFLAPTPCRMDEAKYITHRGGKRSKQMHVSSIGTTQLLDPWNYIAIIIFFIDSFKFNYSNNHRERERERKREELSWGRMYVLWYVN